MLDNKTHLGADDRDARQSPGEKSWHQAIKTLFRDQPADLVAARGDHLIPNSCRRMQDYNVAVLLCIDNSFQ